MPIQPDEDSGTGSCFEPEKPAHNIPLACLICPVTYPGACVPANGDKHTMYGTMEQRRKILSMLSHDIRTPLTIITASAEMLAESGAGMGEEQFAAIGRIKSAAHNTAALVKDFLAILRLESGEINLSPCPTPLPSIVSLTVDSLDYLIARSSAKISTDIPAGLPCVLVDPDRFGRVVTNIVTNALHHCHEGVNVRISARTAEPSGSNVLLEVSDDGPGITPGDLMHIFEWGYSHGIKSRAKGHGLGLMIVKKITELHGGTVEIKSGAGEGTTVRLTLPAAPGRSGKPDAPPTR